MKLNWLHLKVGFLLDMAKIFFFLCAINVVLSFGKEQSSVFFEEFNLEEGYLKTKRWTKRDTNMDVFHLSSYQASAIDLQVHHQGHRGSWHWKTQDLLLHINLHQLAWASGVLQERGTSAKQYLILCNIFPRRCFRESRYADSQKNKCGPQRSASEHFQKLMYFS